MSIAAAAQKPSSRYLVLTAVCLSALVLPLDFSGVAAATSAIGRDFSGSPVMLAWVVNAFMLAFGSTLMTAGALADEYGRKRVFSIGLAAFVTISIALCFARTLASLDILRALQGLAAASTLAGGSAALAQEFEGPARTRAFSLLGTTFGVGLALGPTLAGVLIEDFGWRSIFLTGALVGAFALAFGVPRLRETRNPHAKGPDWAGAATFTAALALFTTGMLQATEDGWAALAVLGLIGAALLAFVAFIAIELRATRPMLDLSLFRYPSFVGVQTLPVATTYSYVVLLVLLPASLIGIEGRGEIDAGLIMLALSAPMLIVPFLTASLTRWLSAGALSAVGLLIAASGLLWLARVPLDAAAARQVPPLLVVGFGTAMPWGLMDGLAVSVVPAARAGMATGIFSTVRVAGEGLGLAIVRAILAGMITEQLPRTGRQAAEVAARLATGDIVQAAAIAPGVRPAELVAAYGHGFQSLLQILALLVGLAAVIVLTFLGWRPASPEP